MDSKKGKQTFMYDLPSPLSPPRVSNRNISKSQPQESRQDKHAKKLMEWQHDHQPPSSYYESSDSNSSKRKKVNPSQHNAGGSQNEVIPSSIPESEYDAHVHRYSFRIAEKRKREQQSSGTVMSDTSPRDYAITVRTLETRIHSNETEMEKIKEHRDNLLKQLHRLHFLVSNDESDIRFYERANMQLKNQIEDLRQQAFEFKYRP